MQIGTPFSGMPRSSSAGMQRNIRSFTTSAVCVPWADRRAFLIWFPIYALWTRCPSTGWVGGSTVPKRWLPAVTAVTFISAKRVPVGTKNGRENRKRKILMNALQNFAGVYPTAAFTVSSGKTLYLSLLSKSPGQSPRWSCSPGGIGLSDLFYKHFARFARDFFGADL